MVLAGVVLNAAAPSTSAAELPPPDDLVLPAPPPGLATWDSPPDGIGSAPARRDAPAIGAISKLTLPDETLVITGEALDGARLRLWADGSWFDVEPLRSANDRMQAVVPAEAPAAIMLVWPLRDQTAGRPIRVNGPEAWWNWPPRVHAEGNADDGSHHRDEDDERLVRLFGRGLKLPGDNRPQVALLHPGGTAETIAVVDANPYHLAARLPEGLPAGHYQLQAHNGSGGDWGWSEPVGFEIVESPPRSDTVFAVEEYRDNAGDDDRQAILLAIEDATANGGGVIQFDARHYRDVISGRQGERDTIVLPAEVPLVLRGAGMGNFSWRDNVLEGWEPGSGTLLSSADSHERYPIFELRGRGQRIEHMTIVVNGESIQAGPDLEQRTSAVTLRGPDQALTRARFIRARHCPHWLVLSADRGAAHQQINGCEFYHAASAIWILPGSDHVRISGCRFLGHYREGRSTDANAVFSGASRLILERNHFTSVDRSRGMILGRTFLSGEGYTSLAYLAHNHSEDVGSHPAVPGIDANTSEQYLFHVSTTDGGMHQVVSAGGDRIELDAGAANMLADSVVTMPWRYRFDRDGQPRDGDWVVFVAAGRGVGQWRLVDREQSRGAVLKVNRPWRIEPDAGSVVIVQRAFRNNIVHANRINANPDPSVVIDSGHKSVGVFWWISCFDNITADNRMENLGVGVGLSLLTRLALLPGEQAGDMANAWNLTRDNRFDNMIGGVGDAAPVPLFYSDHHIGDGWAGVREDFDHWRSVGNQFRGNRGRGAEALLHHGWMRFDEIGVGLGRRGSYEQHGQPNIAYRAGPDKGMVMSVIENNDLSGAGRGVLMAAPANWTLLRNNRLRVDGENENADGEPAAIEFYGEDEVLELLVQPVQGLDDDG